MLTTSETGRALLGTAITHKLTYRVLVSNQHYFFTYLYIPGQDIPFLYCFFKNHFPLKNYGYWIGELLYSSVHIQILVTRFAVSLCQPNNISQCDFHICHRGN